MHLQSTFFEAWSRAWGTPVLTAVFKSRPEDFQVTEQLPFELDGEGEHLWLWVEKARANTQWVVRQLASWAGVRPRDIGTAGLKDRDGIARQWFSIWLPGRPAPTQPPDIEGVRILKRVRHGRKLQTGALSGNQFVITLRQVAGVRTAIEDRLQTLAQEGFPNYFGPQRFGHNGANLTRAQAWVAAGMPRIKPAERSRHLSVLRSAAFNAVLAARVHTGDWNRYQAGDVLQLAGSARVFADDGSADLAERVDAKDLHPTGPLPGETPSLAQGAVLAREQAVLAPLALEAVWQKTRMKSARRPLRALPQEMTWQWLNDETLQLTFFLPAGSYATALLRELMADALLSGPGR